MLELIQVSTSMASPYKSLISLGKTFLRISRIRNIPLTWILARVFVYVPPFISQILDFIYWRVLIFILIYFEWRDTENKQYIRHDVTEREENPLLNFCAVETRKSAEKLAWRHLLVPRCLSISKKNCTQRKVGRVKRAPLFSPSHGSLRLVTSHSRFAIRAFPRSAWGEGSARVIVSFRWTLLPF